MAPVPASADRFQAAGDAEIRSRIDQARIHRGGGAMVLQHDGEVERFAAFDGGRAGLLHRQIGLNRRALEFRNAQDEYNAKVARYNLMVTYPDGLDEPRGKT